MAAISVPADLDLTPGITVVVPNADAAFVNEADRTNCWKVVGWLGHLGTTHCSAGVVFLAIIPTAGMNCLQIPRILLTI
ncbi:MAG TPA: hypothetical protein VFQ02_02545 [Nitrospira sp.]|nr:hypothetical protein [Nitrospira sp.]